MLLNPLRLTWRFLIRNTIQEVVLQPDRNPLDIVREYLAYQVPVVDRSDLEAVIIGELQQLHEGVLMRYRLSPSELADWRESMSKSGYLSQEEDKP
jgi:hypothetical protein